MLAENGSFTHGIATHFAIKSITGRQGVAYRNIVCRTLGLSKVSKVKGLDIYI